MSESTTDLRLPQELITEILLYLPVKSLLRFKCVSKPWLSLISSPEFIRSHLSRSSKEEGNLNHQQLLFTVRNQDGIRGLKGCCLYSALYEADPSTHVYDIENPNRDTEIVGIINGLVCLAINRNHLFICNPALRKSKYFPSSNRLNGACVNYCFGYDESTDDYKVVSLLCLRIDVYYHLEVNVYSLRTDSWRRIDDQDLNFFLPVFGDNGMYANGKIYLSVLEHGAWRETIGCLFYEHGAWKKKIVSLDMVSDKFEEVQQPDIYETTGGGGGGGSHEYDLKLGTLSGGRPSVVCYYHGRKADLWVMDKYGGGEELSWCKVVSIPYDNDNVPFAPPRSHQRVVCILSNGEVVMGNELGLLVYNPKNKEFRNIRLQDDVGSSSKFKAAPLYVVESLVSPGE